MSQFDADYGDPPKKRPKAASFGPITPGNTQILRFEFVDRFARIFLAAKGPCARMSLRESAS